MRLYPSTSAGNKRALLLSLAVTAALSLLPISSHATVFWDDEMEVGATGFSGNGLPGPMQFDTSVKSSGSGSIRIDYPSTCYPDQQPQCGGYADRSFTVSSEIFRRFYIYIPSSFTTGNTETKILSTRPPGNNTWNLWWEFRFGGRTLDAAVSRALDGGSYTISASGGIPNDQWVCVETHEKMNTLGASNGVLEQWVNGTQTMLITNAVMLVNGDTNLMGDTQIFRQVGIGSLWIDRVAVGNARIGCTGSAPTSDTTPPAAPIGLFVR